MRNHTGRRLTVAVASILLVAACAERGGRVTIQSTTTTAATTTTTAAPVEEPITTTTQAPADAEGEDAAPAETVAPPTGDVVEYGPAAEDLIAVVDTEGSVFLLERDGDRRIQLHDGADGVTADYPTWAPSGERIAYVLGPQSPDSAVVTTALSGDCGPST